MIRCSLSIRHRQSNPYLFVRAVANASSMWQPKVRKSLKERMLEERHTSELKSVKPAEASKSYGILKLREESAGKGQDPRDREPIIPIKIHRQAPIMDLIAAREKAGHQPNLLRNVEGNLKKSARAASLPIASPSITKSALPSTSKTSTLLRKSVLQDSPRPVSTPEAQPSGMDLSDLMFRKKPVIETKPILYRPERQAMKTVYGDTPSFKGNQMKKGKPFKKVVKNGQPGLENEEDLVLSDEYTNTQSLDSESIMIAEEEDQAKNKGSKNASKARDRDKRERQSLIKDDKAKAKLLKATHSNTKVKQKIVHLPAGVSVANLGALIGVTLDQIQRKMVQSGFDKQPADYVLTSEIASMLVLEYNMNPIITKEDSTDLEARLEPQDWSIYPFRPPVITIMGHVDHGKTTLLDSLRKTSVAAGEAGGITQHIGAFSVELPSKKRITFLDTPGHAAFSQMRKRGAQVTDIVVLVVAADDGVMPQTIEAINHSLKAQAINKCDKVGVNPRKIMESLLRYEIVVEEMGGEIPAVQISGKTGMGLVELEDTILAMSEIADYRGDPDGLVEGVIVESKLSKQFGNVATMIVKRGTLTPGSILVAGNSWCRVKRMVDENGKAIKKAGPSSPVEVLGWKVLPDAGDHVLESDTEFLAKKVVANRIRKSELESSISAIEEINEKRMISKAGIVEVRQIAKSQNKRVSRLSREERSIEDTNVYRLIIKADVHGSVEAIEGVLNSLPSHEVYCDILLSGVGAVTDSDLEFAQTTKCKDQALTAAQILAFNVPTHGSIQGAAEAMKVVISNHSIIYTLIDHVKDEMSKLLKPTVDILIGGEGTVLAMFSVTKKKKIESIAGCKILSGKITRQGLVRVVRDGVVIHEGNIKTFKHHKKDILEAGKGLECGIGFEEFDAIQEGDIIQAIKVVETKRTFE